MARTSYIEGNNDIVLFVLDIQLKWILIVLAHWHNSPMVDMSLHFGHIILIIRYFSLKLSA